MKDELCSYLCGDLESLHEIMSKFSEILQENYKLSSQKYCTLPSLSLAIYRKCFYVSECIPNITGMIHKNIRNSYYGGLVDVFKPKVKNGFLYDVNSLYPYAMLNDMPVGSPVYTSKPDLHSDFGFFYAKIVAPDIYMTVLPTYNDKGTLITPIGSWTGWYFSEELREALNYGYKIVPVYGYKFSRGKDIFNKFVNHFYAIKSEGKTALKTVAKLVLNSLYGKFGAQEYINETKIMTFEETEKLFKTHDILNVEDLLDCKRSLVTHCVIPNEAKCIESGADYQSLLDKLDSSGHKSENISVVLASAITAYARIYINKLKHLYEKSLIYSDTDSLVTDTPIDPKYIGKQIGLLKLETEIIEGIFVAPKIYYIESPNNIISKTKGVGNLLSKDDFLKLLQGQSVSSTKTYFDRNLSQGSVKIVDKQIVTNASFHKRIKVYDDKGV